MQVFLFKWLALHFPLFLNTKSLSFIASNGAELCLAVVTDE